MKAKQDDGTSTTVVDDDEDKSGNRGKIKPTTENQQTSLELAILSTINEIRTMKATLEEDLHNKKIDLSTFYQKYFKHHQIDNILMPVYANMYAVAKLDASDGSIIGKR